MKRKTASTWLGRFFENYWSKFLFTSAIGLASATGGNLQAGTLYEAESATVLGALKYGTYVDYINASGDYVEWTISVPAAGTYSLVFKYAFGTGNRPLEIKVDGVVKVASLAFPGTGGTNIYNTVGTPVVLSAGTHKIRATAIGYSGGNMDSLEVAGNTVLANQAPVVNAGLDLTLTLPTSVATLAGSVHDDGLPTGSAVIKTWTKVSGNNVTFTNPSTASTSAIFSTVGEYTLKLTASDGQLSNFDTMKVRVRPSTVSQNLPPIVDAGLAQTASLSSAGSVDILLAGSVTDDAKPVGAMLTKSWTKVSGPTGGSVTFSNTSQTNSHAIFNKAGTWVLQLSASDSLLTSADTVQIIINPYVAPPAPNGRDWMIVCQPDTQKMAAYDANAFKAQTSWIAGNHLQKNIRHVIHLGDMVDDSAKGSQWTNAVSAMNNLNPILPHVAITLTIGNHDFDRIYDPFSSVSKWASRFGHNYRKPYIWYGASSNAGNVNEDRNHYCKFTAGGTTFLSIDLQFSPRDADMDWVRQVLAQNPRLPTIVATHGYIYDGNGKYDVQARGDILFQRIVKTHPQIFMVVNGHSSLRGIGNTHNVVSNGNSNPDLRPVIQMSCDFTTELSVQSWFKMITFEMGKNNIHFQTYDPIRNVYILPMVNGSATRQDYNIPMNFSKRFALN